MKKVLSACLVALAVYVGLAGCSGSDGSDGCRTNSDCHARWAQGQCIFDDPCLGNTRCNEFRVPSCSAECASDGDCAGGYCVNSICTTKLGYCHPCS